MNQHLILPRTSFPGLLLAAVIAAAGCGTEVRPPSINAETVTEENSAQLAARAFQELSFEEYRLLQAYVRRAHPDLPGDRLPVGLSVGAMVESQRDYEAAQARRDEPVPSATPREGAPPVRAATSPPERTEAQRTVPASPPPAAAAEAARPAPDSAVDSAAETATAPPGTPAADPEPPAPTTAVVPAGTSLNIRLAESISSKRNQAGDSFEATLEDDLVVGGQFLAPAGARVVGRIGESEASGRVRGRARMSINLARIHVGDDTYSLPTNTLHFEAEGTAREDAKKIGIASGIGAVIGAIAGGGRGAAIGGAIGAGAGTGTVLATPGDEVEFRVEQLFNFRTSREVEMRVLGR